jgi:hypothetical protein
VISRQMSGIKDLMHKVELAKIAIFSPDPFLAFNSSAV